MKNHDSNDINLLWKSREEAKSLVESVITITVNKDLEIEKEPVSAPLSHNLIIDEIVNEKFFKHGLKTSFYKVLDQDEKKVLLRKTGFIAEDKYLLTVGCGLEVIRKHLEKEVKEYKEQETSFRMKHIKNSSRLVHQLERIRIGGRDLSEDLSEQSRRKLVTELMNSKHDANNLLLDMKKEI